MHKIRKKIFHKVQYFNKTKYGITIPKLKHLSEKYSSLKKPLNYLKYGVHGTSPQLTPNY